MHILHVLLCQNIKKCGHSRVTHRSIKHDMIERRVYSRRQIEEIGIIADCFGTAVAKGTALIEDSFAARDGLYRPLKLKRRRLGCLRLA